ncbi:MAG: hypothetical protein IKV87_03280 [Methanobrevibacter sp.]|nr:hypothetical protein [Methanobrevibacter sp.]
MNKKLIEYLIIGTIIILLLYGCYSFMDYKSGGYHIIERNVSDSITIYAPSSSAYSVDGDSAEFRNVLNDFYNMDVNKLNSSDGRVKTLLNHYSKFDSGTLDFKNETCYLLTIEYEDDKGFNYHTLIIPIDSFDKSTNSFNEETTVYLFDGNNRDFVVDAAYESKVVI